MTNGGELLSPTKCPRVITEKRRWRTDAYPCDADHGEGKERSDGAPHPHRVRRQQKCVRLTGISGLTRQALRRMFFARSDTLIPAPFDQNPCAHWRRPMDMILQGWSTSLFQASQQWSTRSS